MLFGKKSKPVDEPPPISMPVSADGETDMRALGRAIWEKKGRILTVTLVVAGIAFVVVNAITPQYSSEARVLL